MKNPSLIPQPHDRWIANILELFEDGKPLSSEQLNFLLQNEKILKKHELDLVFKYYLRAHSDQPDQEVAFTLPPEKLNIDTLHEVRETIEVLLDDSITHIDLKMTLDQFMQFKSTCRNEMVIWHGPKFMPRTFAFPNATPRIIYIQWGKLFGVVKLHMYADNMLYDGYLLVYFEDMTLRSLNQCVLDYAQHHKLELTQSNQKQLLEIPFPHLSLHQEQEHHHSLPTPRPGFCIIGSKNDNENQGT